jgi:hypothetical protein
MKALRARLADLGKLDRLKWWYTDRCDDQSIYHNFFAVCCVFQCMLVRLFSCLRSELNLITRDYGLRCCDGRNGDHLAHHPIVSIFPGITRCPLGDAFHAIKSLTDSIGTTMDASDRAEAVRLIGRAFVKPVEEDCWALARLLQSHEKEKGLKTLHSLEHFYAFVIGPEGKKTYASSIRKTRRSGAETKAELQLIYQAFKDKPGFLRKKAPKIGLPATEDLFARAYKCCDNNCFSDPLPLDEMYRLTGYTKVLKRPMYKFKGSTNKCEFIHSEMNRSIAANVSRISEKNMERNMWLFVDRHNFKVDVEMGKAEKCSGFTFEKMLINSRAEGVLKSSPYPRAASSGYTQPAMPFDPKEVFGWKYYNWIDAQKVAAILDESYARLAAASSSTAIVPATSTAIVPAASAATGAASSIAPSLALTATQSSQVVAAAHRQHRIAHPTHYSSIIGNQPVEITTDDESAVVMECVNKANQFFSSESKSHKKVAESRIFEKAAAFYLDALVENSRCDVSISKELCGRLLPDTMLAEYKRAATGASKRAIAGKMSELSDAKPKKKHKRSDEDAAKDSIATDKRLHREGRENYRYDRQTLTEAHVPLMREFLSNMKVYIKTTGLTNQNGSKLKLRVGGKQSNSKQFPVLLEEFETFFAAYNKGSYRPYRA